MCSLPWGRTWLTLNCSYFILKDFIAFLTVTLADYMSWRSSLIPCWVLHNRLPVCFWRHEEILGIKTRCATPLKSTGLLQVLYFMLNISFCETNAYGLVWGPHNLRIFRVFFFVLLILNRHRFGIIAMVKNSWIANLADHLAEPHWAHGPGPHPDGFQV